MENDESNEIEVEQQDDQAELDGATEESTSETDQAVEDTDWKAEALKQQAINARLSKKLSQPKPQVSTQTNTDTLTRDEAILIAQGMTPDDLDELKSVAQAKGLPLLKAKDTPLFQAYLEHQEAEAKKEKAKLSSSKGSQVTQERSVADLSEEEHKRLVKETFGQ